MKEKCMIRLSSAGVFSLLLIPLLTVSGSTVIRTKTKSVCKSKECLAAAKNLEDSINTDVEPCDDFYQYACGNWPKNNENTIFPIPFSAIQARNIQNEKEILEFLEQNNDKNEPEAVHKARQLYSLCLNRKSYNGIQPLKQILSKIGLPVFPSPTQENAKFDYISATAKAARIAGIKMFFDISVDVNPYNHSVNTIWLSKPSAELDPNSMPLIGNPVAVKRDTQPIQEIDFMEKVMEKMCVIALSSNCATKDENLKMKILNHNLERAVVIEKARIKFNSSYIPTFYTLEQLQNVTDDIANEAQSTIPMLNWTRFLEEMFDGIENVTLDLRNTSNFRIVIHEMSFIKDMIKLIHRRTTKDLEYGLWWKVVSTLLPYADFDTFKSKISVDTPITQVKRCSKIVTSAFGMAISHMYSQKENIVKAKIEVEDMLKHIKESYRQIFQQSSWMDQKTKEKSLKKLASIKSLVAYPNSTELSRILNELYGNVKITSSFLGTMVTKIQDQVKEDLSRLNRINNSTTKNWPVPPAYVNAFYSPLDNLITIPAALLGPPLYIDSLKALIYGSIGSVVGHELTHGFDHSGRRYNENGELENWWNNETLAKYKEKSKCFLKAYDTYNTTFMGIDQKVNSTLTLAEDISDNAGFREALFAYRSYVSEKGQELPLHHFETFTAEQLFTLGFANFWCESPTLISAYLIDFMDHSPSEVRINGVFKNSQEFANIWNCPEGSNMNPSSKKCTLW
ncbi:neprilysin-11-like [Planococcus citri]|uniref:neprilysin-11-like n=1 Tax=Planococcus citri TaxID=170843 RepID=UPI0031F7DBC4